MHLRLPKWRLVSVVLTLASLAISGLPNLGPSRAAYAATTESIWPATATPTTPDFTGDSASVELGVKFKANVAGTATGVRFYKGTGNTGTHIGHLWSASGGPALASATFTSETTSGWQSVNFTNPVQLTVGATYVVSYLAPAGNYAVDAGADPGNLSSAVTNATGSLTALASGASGGNGVFTYTTDPNGAFPSGSFNNSNYWVDVLFNPGGTPPPPSGSHIYSSSYTPAQSAANDSASVSLGVQFQTQTNGYISGVRFYKGAGNGGTHTGQLWTAKHTLLAQATFTSETASGWQDVQFSDMVPVTAGTTYIASYFAPQGHYAFTSGGLSGGITNPPLVALPGSSTPGGNGVFSYGIVPQVPLNATTGSDYAVDVDFTTTYTAPTTPQPTPALAPGAPEPCSCSQILPTPSPTPSARHPGHQGRHLRRHRHRQPHRRQRPQPLPHRYPGQWRAPHREPAHPRHQLDHRRWQLHRHAAQRQPIKPPRPRRPQRHPARRLPRHRHSQAPGLGTTPPRCNTTAWPTSARSLVPAPSPRCTPAPALPPATRPSLPRLSARGAASSWLFDLTRSNIYTREGNPGLAGQITTSNQSPVRPGAPSRRRPLRPRLPRRQQSRHPASRPPGHAAGQPNPKPRLPRPHEVVLPVLQAGRQPSRRAP
jgi:hypothetical protein